jgi:hypothetical protein
MAETHASREINSRDPSCAAFPTRPDLYAALVIILFKALQIPIKKPFSSQL